MLENEDDPREEDNHTFAVMRALLNIIRRWHLRRAVQMLPPIT